ncbi:MAG: hypothetical protein HRT87_09620 [Legionellales bacterium]|nr:hypothetical protein [Legionellales bacterium]
MDNFTKLVHLAACNICDIDSGKCTIDKAKISQILWYMDISYYAGCGKYITDASYEKGEHGVVISDGKLEKALDYLISKKYIVCCDGSIVEFRNLEDSEDVIKGLSHIFDAIPKNFFWWRILEVGDEISKYCALAVAGKINKDDLEWATQEAKKLFMNLAEDELDELKHRQKEVVNHINKLSSEVNDVK